MVGLHGFAEGLDKNGPACGGHVPGKGVPAGVVGAWIYYVF